MENNLNNLDAKIKKNTILHMLKRLSTKRKGRSNIQKALSKSEMLCKFRQVLNVCALSRPSNSANCSTASTPCSTTSATSANDSDQDTKRTLSNVEDQNLQLRQNLEKMEALLKKKDRRINELLQYEYGAKKAIEQKTWQGEALEKEKLLVRQLEKENEKHLLALSENKLTIAKLENNVETLQNQIEELLLVKSDLSDKSQRMNTSITNLTLENEQLLFRCQQLDATLTQESTCKEELNVELKALYKQFQSLKVLFDSQKQTLATQIDLTQDIEERLAQTRAEKEHLQRAFRHCQEDTAAIKQLINQGIRESKDLENRYCEAVSEKIAILTTFHQQQREFDKQQRELIETKEKLKNSAQHEKDEKIRREEELSTLKKRNHHLEEQLTQLNHQKNAIEDKLDLLTMKAEILESERDQLQKTNENLASGSAMLSEQLRQQLDLLSQSIHDHSMLQSNFERAQEDINQHQANLEEKQIQLDEAHQHLAKKVREAALLNEKVEELTVQIADIDTIRETLREASTQLQNDLLKEEKEKNELTEKLQVLEEEIKKWEERWIYAEQRNQQAAEKISELEKVGKRHAQLQNLLSGFGPLPGITDEDNKIAQEIKRSQEHPKLEFGSPLPISDEEYVEHRREENVKPYPNLFDLPQCQERSKLNLFD